MTFIEWFTLVTLSSPVILWFLFYLLFGPLVKYTEEKRGPWYWWVILVFGAVIDLYVNFVIGTIAFLQLPNIHRGFLSARMDDLIVNGTGWRKTLALFIVKNFLQPFDKTGQHTTHGQT